MGSALYRSIRASYSSSVQFILKNAGNYERFANMQNAVYTVRTFLFVFAVQTDKFWFANHSQTAQCRFAVPSIHMRIWFVNCLQAVCKPFGALIYTRLKIICKLFCFVCPATEREILKLICFNSAPHLPSQFVHSPLGVPSAADKT